VQAWGDAAINGLSVLRAEHLQQLVGNYSRVGFHHPGPGYMYLLGAGEVFSTSSRRPTTASCSP
jgi:hypothetical protein